MGSSQLYAKISPVKLFFMIAIPGAISMIASSLWGLFDGICTDQFLAGGFNRCGLFGQYFHLFRQKRK